MLEKMVTACFKVPEREYVAVRVYAAQHKLSMQEVLTRMLLAWIQTENLKVEEIKQ